MPKIPEYDVLIQEHPIDILSKQERLLNVLFFAVRSIESEYSVNGLTDFVAAIQDDVSRTIYLLKNPNHKEVKCTLQKT